MRSLRLVICALAAAALLIPLSLCVFADGTDTADTAAQTAETLAETAAAPAQTAAVTGESVAVDMDALTAEDAASADPEMLADYNRMAFGIVGSSLVDRYVAGETGGTITVTLVACAVACIIIPYLLGSINFGIIVSKVFHKEDIRTYGSGNAGATNMLRTYGKRDAALTFIGDMAKSVASVALGRVLLGLTGGYIALFCCIVGHAFPVFYKFKGGKGVAVSAGGVAALFAFTPRWWIILLELGIFVIVVAITRFISLGSVTAMFVFPLLMSRLELGWSLNILFSFMIAALVIYLHRGNLKRIYQGKESKFTLKHTDKHEKEE